MVRIAPHEAKAKVRQWPDSMRLQQGESLEHELKGTPMNRHDRMELGTEIVTQVVANRRNPHWGQLVGAAEAAVRQFDDNIGLGDDEFIPFVSARRILFGDRDAYVTLYDVERLEHLRDSGELTAIPRSSKEKLPVVSSCHRCPITTFGTGLEPSEIARSEFVTGIQLLGRLATTTSHSAPVISPLVVPPPVLLPQFMKMKTYAAHRDVSVSTVKYWRKLGLPTNGTKGRGVRIMVAEADQWLDAGGPQLAMAALGAHSAQRERF